MPEVERFLASSGGRLLQKPFEAGRVLEVVVLATSSMSQRRRAAPDARRAVSAELGVPRSGGARR